MDVDFAGEALPSGDAPLSPWQRLRNARRGEKLARVQSWCKREVRWPSRVPKLPGVDGEDEKSMNEWLRNNPDAKTALAQSLEPYFLAVRFRVLRSELVTFQDEC
eukprot:4190988-Karenia_brevis.AAC.1